MADDTTSDAEKSLHPSLQVIKDEMDSLFRAEYHREYTPSGWAPVVRKRRKPNSQAEVLPHWEQPANTAYTTYIDINIFTNALPISHGNSIRVPNPFPNEHHIHSKHQASYSNPPATPPHFEEPLTAQLLHPIITNSSSNKLPIV